MSWSTVGGTIRAFNGPLSLFVRYVSPTGDDNNDGKSPDTAWQTISKVNALTIKPGTRILFERSGTWSESLAVPSSGTLANPIIFGAYGNGSDPAIGSSTYGVSATSKNHIYIQDLQIKSWSNSGIYGLSSNHWTIRRCYFTGGSGTGGTGNWGVRFNNNSTTYCDSLTITECEFGTIGAGAATAAQKQSIFFSAILLQGVSNSVVDNNIFHTGNTVAVRLDQGSGTLPANNSDNIISNNEIYSCYAGILVMYSNDTIVRDNHIYDGYGFGIGVAYASLNSTIMYNHIHDLTKVVSSSLWNGIDVSGHATGKIVHNTVYRVTRHCVVLASDNGGADEWTVANNILDASENYIYTVSDYRLLPIANRTGRDVLNEYNNILHAYDQPAINLVTNYDFSSFTGTVNDGITDTVTGWSNTLNAGGVNEIVNNTHVDLIGKTIPVGNYAMHINAGPTGAHALRQVIALTAGVTYTLTFKLLWIQVSGTPGWTQVRITRNGTMYVQANGTTWNTTVNNLVSASNSAAWTTYTVNFTPDVTTNYTILFMPEFSRGRAFLSGVNVYDQSQPTGRLVGSNGVDQGTMYLLDDWQGEGFGENSIDEDPLLDDDGVPLPGSPAINAGVVIPDVSRTHQGVAPDIGYAESQ